MKTEAVLEAMRKGETVTDSSPAHEVMHQLACEAMKITAELNSGYHRPEEIRALFSRLIGRPVDASFGLFPPFYTECGKNIFPGKNVFINFACHFQDQGGIYIGDGVLIGSQTVLATINHKKDPKARRDNCFAPIHIGNGVWIGSHVTILPGVTVGDNAVIAAGAVVTKDVPAGVVTGGVPARVMGPVEEQEKKQRCIVFQMERSV